MTQLGRKDGRNDGRMASQLMRVVFAESALHAHTFT